MKIETNVNTVVSGALESAKVTVNYNAALADLLSNKIYTDVIAAPIRELAANAADHHTKHGIRRPFDVHVPSPDEPWFSVRNYGPAMSHDFVMNNYSQFGLSDKDDSNSLIGGMGVGSKSPLAYADSFAIITWQDGIQRVYVCSKMTEGPTIFLIDAVSLDYVPENGTEIRFDVETDDIGDFRNASRTILAVFDPLPNTPSFDVSPIEKILENKHGYTYGSGTCSLNLIVQMGPVLYLTAVPPPRGIASKIVLKFGIGELPVQASREAVQNDTETNEKIKAKYEKFVAGLKADFDEQYPAPSYSFYERVLAFDRSIAFKQSVTFGQIFVDKNGSPIEPRIWFSRKVSYEWKKSAALTFSVLGVTSHDIPKELTWSELAEHSCHRHTNMTMIPFQMNVKNMAFLVMDSKKSTRPCFFQHLFANHDRVYVIQADTLFGRGGQFTEPKHFSSDGLTTGFFESIEDFKEWASGIPVYRASVDAVPVQLTPPVVVSPETFEYKDYYGTPKTGKVSDFKETDVIYVRENDIYAFDPTVPKDSPLINPTHIDVARNTDQTSGIYRVSRRTWKKIESFYQGKHFFEELRNKKLDLAEELFFGEKSYLHMLVDGHTRTPHDALSYLLRTNPDITKEYTEREKEFEAKYKIELDFLSTPEIKKLVAETTHMKSIKYVFQLWRAANNKGEDTSC